MSTYTIGFIRDNDGDLQVLAALNNSEGLIDTVAFEQLAEQLRAHFAAALPDEQVLLLARQDLPDFIELED